MWSSSMAGEGTFLDISLVMDRLDAGDKFAWIVSSGVLIVCCCC